MQLEQEVITVTRVHFLIFPMYYDASSSHTIPQLYHIPTYPSPSELPPNSRVWWGQGGGQGVDWGLRMGATEDGGGRQWRRGPFLGMFISTIPLAYDTLSFPVVSTSFKDMLMSNFLYQVCSHHSTTQDAASPSRGCCHMLCRAGKDIIAFHFQLTFHKFMKFTMKTFYWASAKGKCDTVLSLPWRDSNT